VNIQASLLVLAGYFGTGGTVTGVPEPRIAEAGPRLLLASPNPFRSRTVFRWIAPSRAGGRAGEAATGPEAALVFDVAGRLVARLTARDAAQAGSAGDGAVTASTATAGGLAVREAAWDGTTLDGSPAPSGVYFFRPADAPGPGERVVRIR